MFLGLDSSPPLGLIVIPVVFGKLVAKAWAVLPAAIGFANDTYFGQGQLLGDAAVCRCPGSFIW